MELQRRQIKNIIGALYRAGLNKKLNDVSEIGEQCRVARENFETKFPHMSRSTVSIVRAAFVRHGLMDGNTDPGDKATLLKAFDAFLACGQAEDSEPEASGEGC